METTTAAATMKAVVNTRYGLDGVALTDVDVPSIEHHQVLVRVRAGSINPADWYGLMGPVFARVIGGGGLRRPKSPWIGADLAGTVESVGKDVTEFKPGDEVFGTCGGSWAEYAAAREVRLVHKPANVSFEEAAAVPVAALTALQALRNQANLQRGQKVLINGASGGVGTFAVQLAKVLGADVTAVCSTRNVELVGSLGADRVVDYKKDDFTRLEIAHDVMLDIAGSRPLRQAARVLTKGATVVVVGGRMNTGLGPLPHLVGTMISSRVRSQTAKFYITKIEKDDLLYMQELLAAGTVRSIIDRTYPLSQVHDALRYFGEGHARGKVILTP